MKTDIKLKLKIKDVEIELTRTEIKELKSILDEIFPQKEVVREWYPYWPYPYRHTYYDYLGNEIQSSWTITSDNTELTSANYYTLSCN